ncbi:Bacteriochlorophyllide d C-12(1)-methyltransferase [subsurface metagenome]
MNSGEADRVFRIHRDRVRPKGIFSIMGGPHPTFYPDTIGESGVDAYCIGEGEAVFSEVLQSLESGSSIDNIQGIKTVKKSNPLHNLVDLSTLPMPDRDLVLGNTFLGEFPRKTFFSSRGCPFSCTYCLNPTFRKMFKGKGTWCRRFSVERILDEIKDIQSKYRLEFVKFDDDLFAMKADDWLEEFSDRFPREIGLRFNCLLRLDYVTEPLLKMLANAGCFSIIVAIDSASDRIRTEILHRSMSKSNDELMKSLLQIKKHGMNAYVNYITSLPTATEEDEIETIKISRGGQIAYANYSALVPFKGTEIWQYCKDRGLYDAEAIPKSLFKPSLLKGFTRQQQRVSRNVLLLGALAASSPEWLNRAVIWLIRRIPPNFLFVVLYSLFRSLRMGTKMYPLKANLFYQIKMGIFSFISNVKDSK